MNRTDNQTHDILKDYIDPARIEKAPEDFTSKVMSGIQTEKEEVKIYEKNRQSKIIPVIAVFIILALSISAYLLPESTFGQNYVPDFFRNITFPALKLNLKSFNLQNLPEGISYAFICILLLSVCDRLLSGLFHRQRKQR